MLFNIAIYLVYARIEPSLYAIVVLLLFSAQSHFLPEHYIYIKDTALVVFTNIVTEPLRARHFFPSISMQFLCAFTYSSWQEKGREVCVLVVGCETCRMKSSW